MSLTPEAGAPPSKSGGWLTIGTMTRAIRFQSSFSGNGITGWTFKMNRVCSSGPTPCSQLNWNGTLTRSEIGFESFFASSALSLGEPGAGWAVCCPRLAAGSRSAIRAPKAIALLSITL
jgi:hypothetical protein